MILLIEPDKDIRKKLCDLLCRERIIAIGTRSETLEMICRFKNRFNIIIANINLLHGMIMQGTLFRLCQKLDVDIPPILGLYSEADESAKSEFQKYFKQYKLIKYDEKNIDFPKLYISEVRGFYPAVIADVNKAKEIWLQKEEPQDFIDPRKWLEEEGFLEPHQKEQTEYNGKEIEEFIPSFEKRIADKEREVVNDENDNIYKDLFLDYKRKYNELLQYVNELTQLAQN